MKTTEHYMDEKNGRKSKDSQMVGDYGVEEWRDGGKSCIFSLNMILFISVFDLIVKCSVIL